MKKIFSISVIAAFALCMFANVQVNAQKVKFAGTVKIAVKYEGDTDPQKHVPAEAVFTIFGNKVKLSQQVYTQILDGDAGTVTILLDFPGNRVGYVIPKEDFLEKQSTVKFTYTKSDETKTICGYVCTRYDITAYDIEEDEETKIVAYTTTEIGENTNINAFEYPGLTGFPLYTEVESDGVKAIQEIIEVKKTKVKAVDFLVPSDYKMLTKEEYQELMQQLMGGGRE